MALASPGIGNTLGLNAVDLLTKEDIIAVERIQMAFLQIVLGNMHEGYELARIETKLKTLEKRRTQLNLICI